jgi:hypothetical protein
MLAGKVKWPVTGKQNGIGGLPRARNGIPLDPSAERVGNLRPGNRRGRSDQLAVAGMKSFAILDRRRVALRRSHGRELQARGLARDIGPEQHAFLPVKAVRRVPDLRDVAIRPADAAVKLLVGLPPAPRRLECHLHRRPIKSCAGRNRLLHRRAEIGRYGFQHRKRNRADHEIRVDGASLAGLVVERDDPSAIAGAADLHDFLIELDHAAERPHEGADDGVHAADRLQHGGRLTPQLGETERENDRARSRARHDLVQREGRLMLSLLVAGARCVVIDVTRARGTGIGQAGVEIAEDPQHRPKIGVLRHAPGGERGNGAPQIGIESPRRLRFAAELGVELDEGGVVVVDEQLQCDAQFAAVAENSLMVTGKPRRAGIEVEVAMGLPVDLLRGIRLDDAVAAAHGPHPSAGARTCFEDLALIACLAEAIR